jgi:hypothetical protein
VVEVPAQTAAFVALAPTVGNALIFTVAVSAEVTVLHGAPSILRTQKVVAEVNAPDVYELEVAPAITFVPTAPVPHS